MRREFDLPEADRECLDARDRPWETIVSAGRWLLIEGFLLPAGYRTREVAVALSIEPSYPDTEIDMAYFHPALELESGGAIGALTPHEIDGRAYQRWSRHRPKGQWRPGIDCVGTHLIQVEDWLRREVDKK
jgi:hypothetical protein